MNKSTSLLIGGLIVILTVVALYRVVQKNMPSIVPTFSGIAKEQQKNSDSQPVLKDTELSIKEGFSIGIYAENLGKPRVIIFDESKRMIVSDSREGIVWAVEDRDGDGFAESESVLLSGLNNPHGLVWYENDLLVATKDAVTRYTYNHRTGEINDGDLLINLPNPAASRHVTRSLDIGPDGRLYISIGSSCDTCIERDNRLATIVSVDIDSKVETLYATGLRNAVYFEFHPVTGELFATEMGRDHLGDDLPPDEINIVKEGKSYGWPFCYGARIYDTNFGGVNNCENSIPSFIDLPAHVAPLGIVFAPESWGEEYVNDLLVAYHGSWNSSVPVGYKVVRFDYKNGEYEKISEDFLTGFLKNGEVKGRPAGLTFDKEGNLFITDDSAGVVYQVRKK